MERTNNECTGTVTTGFARLSGQYVASCDSCRYVCAYWDADDCDPETGEMDWTHERVTL